MNLQKWDDSGVMVNQAMVDAHAESHARAMVISDAAGVTVFSVNSDGSIGVCDLAALESVGKAVKCATTKGVCAAILAVVRAARAGEI